MLKKTCHLSIFMLATVITAVFTASGTVHAQRIVTYETALEIAQENSPDIIQTQLNLERNRELLNAQNAGLKSQFSLSLEPFKYSRDRSFIDHLSDWSTNKSKSSLGSFRVIQPIKQTDGTLSLINSLSWQDAYSGYSKQSTNDFNNNLYVSFSQPIFTYNRTETELRELELDLESTELTYAIQQLNLESKVAAAFYNVYETKMSLEIAGEELANQQKSRDIIKNKVDAGLAALEELYQSELDLAESKSSYQDQQMQLENALDNFKQLIGVSLDEQIIIDADIALNVAGVDQERAISTALSKRMELRELEIGLENSKYDLIKTKALNEFKGNIELSYGIIGTNEQFADMYDSPTKKESVGFKLEIPLWDWGEKESRIKASEANIKRQRLSLEEEKKTIRIEIRKTVRNLANLVNQISIAEQNVKNAELTYEINLERYSNGDLTSMDLALYQNQLSQSKNNHVKALIDYKLALLDLKIQSLWDFAKDEPVLPALYSGADE